MQDFLKLFTVLLEARDRLILILLLVSSVVNACLQTLAVAAIMPFVALLIEPSSVDQFPQLQALYSLLGFSDSNDFIVFFGGCVLALLLLGNAFMAFDIWLSLRFGFGLEHRLASRLLNTYLNLPHPAFRRRDPTSLCNNVINEVENAAVGLVLGSLSVFGDVMMAVFMVALLLIIDPWITLSTLVVLGLAYVLIYSLLQGRINKLGGDLPELNTLRMKRAQEGLTHFRLIKLGGHQKQFVARFDKPSDTAARNNTSYHLMESLPILLLETLGFGLLLVIAIIAALRTGGASDFIPVIAFYGMAAYRLIPSMKEIFSGVADIRYNLPAAKVVVDDLSSQQEVLPLTEAAYHMPKSGDAVDSAKSVTTDSSGASTHSINELQPERPSLLVMRGVSFSHTQQSNPTLKEVNLELKQGDKLCVTGPSGAGKSTLIDLLLGLLEPNTGSITRHLQATRNAELNDWQKAIGYVPQSVALIEDSVTRNIAFGVPDEQIDQERVRQVARLAQIDNEINHLAEGYDSILGLESLQLSGGQTQRLGVARALYHDPELLVLDEASSGLDHITENALLKSLLGLKDKTLVFVSHKANVASQCDQVLLIVEGMVRARGTYAELTDESHPWRNLLCQELAPAQKD